MLESIIEPRLSRRMFCFDDSSTTAACYKSGQDDQLCIKLWRRFRVDLRQQLLILVASLTLCYTGYYT